MKHIFRSFIFIFSLFSISAAVYAEKLNIDFYGVYSSTGDKSMIEMTRNLYFAQLKEMEDVNVTDKTSGAFFSKEDGELAIIQKEATVSQNISFFVEIETSGNGQWKAILQAYSPATEKTTVTKEYSSYYKILTDSKEAIVETLASYRKLQDIQLYAEKTPHTEEEQKAEKPALSTTTESIAGTWYGEDYIDKIVIMRGGRGFIIYKNGATMNIKVSIDNSSESSSVINIIQAGRPNASFFPELSRKTALENAPRAQPLEWQLTLTDSNTLHGSKKTLIEDESSPSGASQGTASVTWTRK